MTDRPTNRPTDRVIEKIRFQYLNPVQHTNLYSIIIYIYVSMKRIAIQNYFAKLIIAVVGMIELVILQWIKDQQVHRYEHGSETSRPFNKTMTDRPTEQPKPTKGRTERNIGKFHFQLGVIHLFCCKSLNDLYGVICTYYLPTSPPCSTEIY